MHILVIPSFYSERNTPVSGLFFKRLTKLLNLDHKVGLIYVEQQSLKFFFNNIFRGYFFTEDVIEEGVLTYRYYALNLLNQYKIGSLIWIWLSKQLAKKYIKECGVPDVIFAHNVFNAGIAAKQISDIYKIPYVITEHSSSWLYGGINSNSLKIAEYIFENSICNISVSSSLKISIQRLISGLEFIVIPNVVNTDLFKINLEKNEKFTFLNIGHLYENKGHYYLISEFKKFIEINNNSQLLIYGIGPERNNIVKLIRNLKLENHVFLMGNAFPKELSSILGKAHCLVSSSKKETFGVVLIEAMSCGVPVIATRSGGPEDFVFEFNGLLVNYGIPDDLSNAMIKLFSNHNSYDPKLIRQYTIDNFGEFKVKDTLNNLLFKLLK